MDVENWGKRGISIKEAGPQAGMLVSRRYNKRRARKDRDGTGPDGPEWPSRLHRKAGRETRQRPE